MGHRNAPGALVISLDFELRWGVRDLYPIDGGAYRANLLGAREAIPRMLDLFEEYEVAATWATVGMLFAQSRAELERHKPAHLPNYADPMLNPYRDPIGGGEGDDPLHYAPSLIAEIARRPGQEIASHTFGHYYPLEPGHDPASFAADLASAVSIAEAHGHQVSALVFPRNQINPDYAHLIRDAGFTVMRGNSRGWLYDAAAGDRYRRADIRAGRLLDNYVPMTGNQVFAWEDIPFIDGVCALPASHFLRPYSAKLAHLDGLRFRRIASGIREAAESGGVYHLWWHPHNFGLDAEQNLAFLRRLLEVHKTCRARHGMRSLSMTAAGNHARSAHASQHAA